MPRLVRCGGGDDVKVFRAAAEHQVTYSSTNDPPIMPCLGRIQAVGSLPGWSHTQATLRDAPHPRLAGAGGTSTRCAGSLCAAAGGCCRPVSARPCACAGVWPGQSGRRPRRRSGPALPPQHSGECPQDPLPEARPTGATCVEHAWPRFRHSQHTCLAIAIQAIWQIWYTVQAPALQVLLCTF